MNRASLDLSSRLTAIHLTMFTVIDYSLDPATSVANTASTQPTTVDELKIRLGPRPCEPTPIGYEIPEWFTGLSGVAFIAVSLWSSIRYRKSAAALA